MKEISSQELITKDNLTRIRIHYYTCFNQSHKE